MRRKPRTQPISRSRRTSKDVRNRRQSLLVGIFAVGCAALLIAMIVQTITRHEAMLESAAEHNAPVPRTADTMWDAAWPRLPPAEGALPRPLDDVRAAYAFAARRGDLLPYIPCYCGCERERHRSNLDCYIKRWAHGTPQWDDHAFT